MDSSCFLDLLLLLLLLSSGITWPCMALRTWWWKYRHVKIQRSRTQLRFNYLCPLTKVNSSITWFGMVSCTWVWTWNGHLIVFQDFISTFEEHDVDVLKKQQQQTFFLLRFGLEDCMCWVFCVNRKICYIFFFPIFGWKSKNNQKKIFQNLSGKIWKKIYKIFLNI